MTDSIPKYIIEQQPRRPSVLWNIITKNGQAFLLARTVLLGALIALGCCSYVSYQTAGARLDVLAAIIGFAGVIALFVYACGSEIYRPWRKNRAEYRSQIPKLVNFLDGLHDERGNAFEVGMLREMAQIKLAEFVKRMDEFKAEHDGSKDLETRKNAMRNYCRERDDLKRYWSLCQNFSIEPADGMEDFFGSQTVMQGSMIEADWR